MNKFALVEVTVIRGKITFYYLLEDGINLYELFEKDVKANGNLSKQLDTVQSRMQEVADLKRLPVKKFRDLTPKNDPVKEYEIKTDDLRVYLIHEEHTGHIIVCGGLKNAQKKDIRQFRSLKRRYLDSK